MWQVVPESCSCIADQEIKGFRQVTHMAELTRKEVILVLAAAPDMGGRRSEHRVCLAGVDLSGLDLRGLNLAHADLAGANMQGCDLSDARLFEADLSSADLTDALLCGVYADGATFVAARLVRADFRKSRRDLFYGTHLIGADFRGADLTDARFDGARLAGAEFHESSLDATRGSFDSIDRREQSVGPLPLGPFQSRQRARPLPILSPASTLWCRRNRDAASTEAA